MYFQGDYVVIDWKRLIDGMKDDAQRIDLL